MIDYSKILEVTLVLTQKCNLNCWYCYWHDEPDVRETVDHDFEKVIEFIKVHWRDKLYFQFYGGEPTIHPKLIEYTDRLHEEFDPKIYMHTNLMRSVNYFKQFNKYPDFNVHCSFHSDHVVDIEGWFRKAYAIKNSKIYFMVQENNFDLIYDLYLKHREQKKCYVCPIRQILNTDLHDHIRDVIVQNDIYEHSFQGFRHMMCMPGYIIRENGDVMRCWAQMQQRYKIMNIYKDEMKRIPDWMLCGYHTCFCDQPYPRKTPKEYVKDERK